MELFSNLNSSYYSNSDTKIRIKKGLDEFVTIFFFEEGSNRSINFDVFLTDNKTKPINIRPCLINLYQNKRYSLPIEFRPWNTSSQELLTELDNSIKDKTYSLNPKSSFPWNNSSSEKLTELYNLVKDIECEYIFNKGSFKNFEQKCPIFWNLICSKKHDYEESNNIVCLTDEEIAGENIENQVISWIISEIKFK